MKYLIIILGILSNAMASVLIKYATLPPRKFPSITEPGEAIRNWPFWVGLFLYGIAFILYGMSLARFPLNIAHPLLTAGAIAFVALFSLIVFQETFAWNTIAGILFILVGVILITSK